MGYCVEGEGFYDAFLSYASADNDAHNGWVQDFEAYLKEKVEAELRRTPAVGEEDAQRFSICRDETTFPQHGSLTNVIDEKVRQSAFLFVFLGKAYLKSKYCLSELNTFREVTGGTIEGALQRTYVIVLDREAVELLRHGDPQELPEERKRSWTTLCNMSQQAIRKEDFLHDRELLPVRASELGLFDNAFHQHCMPIVQEFTSKLIQHRMTLHPQRSPSAPPLPVGDRILIGVVPPRLVQARDELVRALGTVSVDVMNRDELCHDPAKFCERFAGARLFIQPFDAFAPLFGLKRPDPDPLGGHLGLQKQLFDACQERGLPAPGMEMLWWEPVPSNAQDVTVAPAPVARADAEPIAPCDTAWLDKIPSAHRRHCTAHDLAAEIQAPRSRLPQSRLPVTATVWVEWEERDKSKIQQAKELVHIYFDKAYSQSATIEFGDADWAWLKKEVPERPDGVVIVINEHKDDAAVREQMRTLSDLEDVVSQQMFPGIFYMRPAGMLQPPRWHTVRVLARNQEFQYNPAELAVFRDLQYDPAELTAFVERLFDVVSRKYFKRSTSRE